MKELIRELKKRIGELEKENMDMKKLYTSCVLIFSSLYL